MPTHEHADGPSTVSNSLTQPARREPRIALSRAGLADFAWRMLLAVLILAVAYLVWRGAHVLLLAFAGVLFAVFLSALSDWLSRHTGLRYGRALAVVVVGLILLIGGLGWLLANRLAIQAAEMSEQLPRALEQVQKYLEAYPWGRYLLEQAPRAMESAAQGGILSQVTGIFSGVTNFLVAVVVMVFVGIFGAAEPDVYKRGLLHLIPFNLRPRVAQALDEVGHNLRAWLVGQVVLMVALGVTTTVALWLMGIPMALTLGLLTGILEVIPYIGAWAAAVPVALIALLIGPGHLLMVLALYLGLHLLEGYLLAPLVQRRAIHVPPALTLVTQLLLGELLGVLGLLVAAPLLVTVIVFVKRLYVEDTLGDKTEAAQSEPGKCTQAVSGNGATADRTNSGAVR